MRDLGDGKNKIYDIFCFKVKEEIGYFEQRKKGNRRKWKLN